MCGLSRNASRRAVLSVAAAACAVAAFVPAGAAPSTIGQKHDDTGTLVIKGVDGQTYQVTVELVATQGEPSQAATLSVSYVGCNAKKKCGFTYTYGLTLSSSQYSFPDKNSATVSTTLVGKPVRLSWSSAASSGENLQGNVGNDTVSESDPTSGGNGALTAQIFGVSCNGSGTVANYYGAFPAPEGARTTGPSKVPAGFVANKHHKPACQSG